jgi:UDP-N-acetylmuramoylalanine--D-glutamate ligase
MSDENYLGKNVLVIGLGISGRAAVHFLQTFGANVIGVDQNAEQLQNHPEILLLKDKGLIVRSDGEKLDLNVFNLIVVSPGISTHHPLIQKAYENKQEVIGEIELGCRAAKQSQMIAITGTNGKTTVTLLITHILQESGFKARALGNVGVPLTREILTLDSQEIGVLELSSYQLDTMVQAVLDEAIILNVTPDHLERYGTMEKYAQSKFRIGKCLKESGKIFINYSTAEEYKNLLNFPYFTYGYLPQCDIYTDQKDVYARGKFAFKLPPEWQNKKSHDLENVLAAYAICSHRGITPEQFLQALETFIKPPHRIEFVLEKNGVRYYDDSKGTNIDAVIRAVESLDSSIILIAGGVDKGASYQGWIHIFKNHVKEIYAIGQAARKIQAELSQVVPVYIKEGLDHAVQAASLNAEKGDIVLLSPGCASFDMFKDYVHRGQEFQRLVKLL